MASRSMRLLVFVILVLFLLANATADARKLLGGGGGGGGAQKAPSFEGSLVLSALPTGDVPPSSPNPGVNAAGAVGERLLAAPARTSSVDRMLGSVPSPGVGH